jgi:hypothetical protein
MCFWWLMLVPQGIGCDNSSGGWRLHFQGGFLTQLTNLCWLLTGSWARALGQRPQFMSMDTSPQDACISSQHAGCGPGVSIPGKQSRQPWYFYDLTLEVIECQFHQTPLLEAVSRPARVQKREIHAPPLDWLWQDSKRAYWPSIGHSLVLRTSIDRLVRSEGEHFSI